VTCGEDRTVKLWNRDWNAGQKLSPSIPFRPPASRFDPTVAMLAVGGQVGAAYASISRWRMADWLPPFPP
jgi:hypothetical protein